MGTGDGAFVRRTAGRCPDRLVIGVDANVAGLRAASRRRTPANALFARLAIDDAPGDLAGLADAVTVLLPWGSLLRAVAVPEPAALCRLRALCRPGAELRVVFGYTAGADGIVAAHGLPRLDDPASRARLLRRYRDAGLDVTLRPVPRDELRGLPTTWAGKLAWSGHDRQFVELTGRAPARTAGG